MKIASYWMSISYRKGLCALATAALTPRQGRCLAWYCFDGLRQREVGLRLGTTQQAVSRCLSRARRRLARVGLAARRIDDENQQGTVATRPTRELDQLGPEEIKAQW